MVSVIVCTYNAKFEKIIFTLCSVLYQKNVMYEIIVADDNSDYTYFREIEDFFVKNSFSNYLLLGSSENRGTVKNFKNAVKYAKGEFVKGIGAGDLFYDEYCLFKIESEMQAQNCKIGFGLMQSYYFDEFWKLHLSDYFFPKNIRIVENKDNKKLWLDLVSGDSISGATLFFKKEYLLQHLTMIENSVKYVEDFIRILAAIEKEPFAMMNEFIIWYEHGEGISTSMRGKQIIKKDYILFCEYLKKRYHNNYYAKKYLWNNHICKIKNNFIRKFCLALFNPIFVYGKLVHKIFANKKISINKNAFLYRNDFIQYVLNESRVESA